ncbi:unnamed protein product [Adineta steineri]|uniref:non-specific serine/threonine protein kinase n=1 Tax=Adineta steineri TaxID=433720 RepID=A0A815LLJ2_9BILA|nr:unnamed protein product [Adineta steineri]
MRKFFSQKSKNKTHQQQITLTGPSSTVSPFNKDDELQINAAITRKSKSQATPSQSQTIINSTDQLINSTSDESISSEQKINTQLKQDENLEKSKKLFVVVSDVDSACTSSLLPTVSKENPDSHLLSVDECESAEPLMTLQQPQQQSHPITRKRSSTGSGQHLVRYREQNTKKFVEERLRRRSWMVSQAQLLSTSTNCPNNMSTSTNNSQSPDILTPNQQTVNLVRLRRLRLGQSEPNLNSLQMNYFYQMSPSLKSSPRTSSATTSGGADNNNNSQNNNSNSTNVQLTPSQNQQQQHYFPFPLRRPSSRRSNLSGLNLINLKYALRKQLSPQQQPTLCATLSEPQDTNKSSATFNPSSSSAFKPIINLDDNSNRRWSLTSAPSSSGYGTTTPITCHSHESSQYSSFERLQHQQQQLQQQQQQQQQNPQQHICTCKQLINIPNSNEGSLSNSSPSDDFIYGSLQRLESRSLSMSMLDANISSSPCKMMIMPDHDINTMAYIYKERYPTAKVQMEERLQNFIDTYKTVDKFEYCSDGSARFIHNQIVELAKDCLEKSHEDLITTLYFNEMTSNLERLLLNTKEKCPQAIENLQTVVRNLLLTTARSARLLECLEFDPEDFLRTLDEVECQAKINGNIKQDIPKYICSKLNLERNPLDVFDALQVHESFEIERQDSTDSKASVGLSESESESFTDSNYLTITPNSTFPPIEHPLSAKGPCEDDFEVIKLISNGAYGAVHLVKHRQSHERYAMKKISKTHLILRNQVEQAFVERDIMTFTDNPFVVALICTFETKKHLCLVMEYVEGGDVATLLKNIGGPLNIDIARMYFAETTLAVEYLHSYGIIHRDLKPDNLLITAIGHIKLTDFGLSKIGLMSLTTNFYEKHIDKETKAFNDKQICGTPTYIAPEVILRKGYGKPVDWWSMGIILYEFLVGMPPFTGNTPDELFVNVINGQMEWPDILDESTIDLSSSACYDSSEQMFCPEAKNLIEQLLEHDPSQRLGTLGGAYEIRTHPFCAPINWNTLLREKADFVPVLESPDDTSYFDTREDRYQHSDDDILSSTTNKQTQVTLPDNDSDILFASFSSVSLKYVSELSGNHKQRNSNKTQQHQDSTTTNTTASEMSSTDVSRANSCSECFHPDSVIRINSPSGFQPLIMSQSMPVETREKVEPSPIQATFGSDTFEPLLVSSDDNSSESSSIKKNPSIFIPSDKLLLSNITLSRKNSSSSSSVSSSVPVSSSTTLTSNTDDKKTSSVTTSTPSTTTKHYKQRKTSLKLLEQQNANDSGDDNNQQQKSKSRHHHHHHHHKKVRVPRALSPLQPKQSSTLPTPANNINIPTNTKSQDIIQSNTLNVSPQSSEITPTASSMNENEFKKSASSNSLVPPPPHSITTAPTTTTSTGATRVNSYPITTVNNPNKPVKYNNQQQRNFPRSLSKSFSSSSSSSSPPPFWLSNPDDRSYRHTQRHNMAVSPLERDTTLKAHQQNSFSSSTISPIHSITNNLRPPIIIRRGPRSFGFTLRAVKVFHGNTDYYTTQHVVVAVEGPAQEAGLKPNDVITHVNERPVAGLLHPEVVKLILSGSPKLSIRAIPCSETQIRTGGRRRSPSKQKIRYQPQHQQQQQQQSQQQHYYDNKKTQTSNSYHQPYCQKYRTNSSGNSINMNSNNSNGNNSNAANLNKKHPQNNSLFRRLSERKVARDMEAAAIAAGSPLTIPTTLITNTHTNNTLTTTNTSILSSSLPLLLFNQSNNDHNNDRSLTTIYHQPRPNILDSSEWPPLQAPLKPPTPTGSEPDSPQPTLLPSIVRQKSQISVSPLARCPSSSSHTNSSAHPSLCKTLSEPPIFPRHNSHSQYLPRQTHSSEHNHAQNYLYTPMTTTTTTHKRKVFHQKLTYQPPSPTDSSSQPPFILENNTNRNSKQNSNYFDIVYHDQSTRSSSTESSASSTSTLMHVDNFSATPVVIPTKFFYRRR